MRRSTESLAALASLIACVASASAVNPPWSDGFESYANGGLAGGDWYVWTTHSAVTSSGVPHSGGKQLRWKMDWDYAQNSFNQWGYLTDPFEYETAAVTFSPSGDTSVVRFTGWAKIGGLASGQRDVALYFELLNQVGGTATMIGMWRDGSIEMQSVYGYDYDEQLVFVDFARTGPLANPGDWNKFTTAIDFSNGLVRFELNDSFLFLSGTVATALNGVACDASALPKAPSPAVAQPTLYFDDLSAATSAHCDGDLNIDGQVDDEDFTAFDAQYNIYDCAAVRPPVFCTADLNKDGIVDDGDFAIFIHSYDRFGCP